MLSRTSLILLAWLLLVPPGSAQTKLRWQFKPGEVFYHEARQDTETVITVRDQVQSEKLHQIVVCRFKVLDVKGDETVVLERRVEEVKFEEVKGLPDAERIAGLMKGMTFTLTLDLKKRQVTKLEGYEDFFTRLAKLDENTARSLKDMLPAEAISVSIEADFFHTPAQDVPKGGQWVRPFRMSMGPLGSLTGETAYKYANDNHADNGDKAAQHLFTFTTTAKIEPAAQGQATPNGVQFTGSQLKIDKAEGEVSFNATKGRIAKAVTRMTFSITLAANDKGQKLDLVLKQNSTQTCRFLDSNPLEKQPTEKK